jgi:hypothetical protein
MQQLSLAHISASTQRLSVRLLTYLPSILNVLAIKVFGEAEFWLSGGKVSFATMPSWLFSRRHTDFIPRSSSS